MSANNANIDSKNNSKTNSLNNTMNSPLSNGRTTRTRAASVGASSPSSPSGRKKTEQQEDAYTRVQRLMAAAKTTKKEWSTPSATFRSSTPRLARTALPFVDAFYGEDTCKEPRRAQKSGWGVSKVPQREPPRQITDRFYDAKHPNEVRYMTRGQPSTPSSPRMPPTPDNKVPPVGVYTSPFISCGMGM